MKGLEEAIERDGVSKTKLSRLLGISMRSLIDWTTHGGSPAHAELVRRLDAFIDGRLRAVEGQDGKWDLVDQGERPPILPEDVEALVDMARSIVERGTMLAARAHQELQVDRKDPTEGLTGSGNDISVGAMPATTVAEIEREGGSKLVGLYLTEQLSEELKEAAWRKRMNASQYARQVLRRAIRADLGLEVVADEDE